jgi:hypothetical protein
MGKKKFKIYFFLLVERNGSGTKKKEREKDDIHMTFTIKNCRVVVLLFRNNNNEKKRYTLGGQRECVWGVAIRARKKMGCPPPSKYSNGEF